MRLLTKTTIWFFALLVLLLCSTAYFLFRQFSEQLRDRSDKELLTEEAGWIQYLDNNAGGGERFILKTREVSVYPTDSPISGYALLSDVYGDILNANRHIPFRELSQVIDVNGTAYQVLIRKSQEQRLALQDGITRVILIVFAALFLITVVFNWIINRTLWIPFNKSLGKIQTAELQRMEAMHFEKTDIYEFNELNKALNTMTSRISRDFTNMKEFTEHAAHEMQTPVAVVQSKLELLLQESNLSDAQLQSVAEASEVLNRLGKLNQGLLLLSKIENDQYMASEEIDLGAITQKYLVLFGDLIKEKQLVVQTRYSAEMKVRLHPVLADSLISNLLGNAIKYNFSGGYIHIETGTGRYEITNSSRLEPISADKLFTRFYASKNGDESSNGLGLAIVSRIAASGQLHIAYSFDNGEHKFVLRAGE